MEKKVHILEPSEIRELGRPIGQVEDEQLEAFIEETEQLYVKPMLGDKLFIDLIGYISDTTEDDYAEHNLSTLAGKYSTLLSGGTYEDSSGEPHLFSGLRKAVSYYVYAQNIMSGDFQSTRYGMVIKDNDYSHPLTGKERSDAYNNTLGVANRYMGECVAFCKVVGLITAGGRHKATGGLRIRKIG